MYALPDDFEPTVFVGRELERICFLPYGVELHFGTALSLTVFGPLRLGEESLREEGSSPSTLVRFTELSGRRVTAAHTEGRGSLVLILEEGQALRVVEDGDAYECFHLHVGGREIIV